MTRVFPIRGAVQHYAWGSRDFIPTLVGEHSPAAEPCAELWLGTHRRGPAVLKDGANAGHSLADLIASAPADLLGDDVAGRFNNQLPFLLKVLAADQPLSIQCHPSAEQAREGFLREEQAGVPLDAPSRNYRDENPKPELLVALTTFCALKGFRPVDELIHRFRSLALAPLAPLLEGLEGERDEMGVAAFFSGLLLLDEDRRQETLTAFAARVEDDPSPEGAWSRRLLELYPGDIGALAPFLLQLLVLSPGQGLFLEAGTLHAYLEGAGIEVMASSDNVLRGGLTPKHVDVAELLRVARFDSTPARILDLVETSGRYRTPASEFALDRLEIEGRAALPPSEGPRLLLCTDGLVVLPDDEERHELLRGEAAFAAAGYAPDVIEGLGTLWVVSVPRRAAS